MLGNVLAATLVIPFEGKMSQKIKKYGKEIFRRFTYLKIIQFIKIFAYKY